MRRAARQLMVVIETETATVTVTATAMWPRMARYGALLAALMLALGCTGELGDLSADSDAGAGGAGGDGGTGSVSLRIVEPAAAAAFVTDTLSPSGRLAAQVPVAVEASGAFAKILIESSSGTALGELVAEGTLAAQVIELGSFELVVRAVDANGASLGEARVGITVAEPTLASCQAWLDLYELDYTAGPSKPGVADPVTVVTPINGMPYRYSENATPRTTFFMDCTLARSLAEAAPIFREQGIVEVVDIGVYNYRCIGGGTPPDCPNGVSQHAYAKALDIAGVVDANQTYYSVNDDWVIDPSAEATCEAGTEDDKDELLHELICELKANRVWNIVLTPNYNSAHRNHFHVDMTTGSDFMRAREGVDTGPDLH